MKKKSLDLINIQKKLIKILEKKKKLNVKSFKEKISCRFLEKGYLDSIGIINFIISIEEEFNIKFSSKDTESEKFRTLNGISKIILKK